MTIVFSVKPGLIDSYIMYNISDGMASNSWDGCSN